MAPPPAPLARIALSPQPRRRVLVIEDDAVVRRMLADAFAGRGFEALTAEDGAAGMSRLIDELLTLALVVTDVYMPGLDGASFIETVRHAGGEHDLAIVAVSARLSPDLRARLLAAGADVVVDKAAGPEAIVASAVQAYAGREERRGDG